MDEKFYWFQIFILVYIYEVIGIYNIQRIEILEDIAKKYQIFEKDPSDENLNPLLQVIVKF